MNFKFAGELGQEIESNPRTTVYKFSYDVEIDTLHVWVDPDESLTHYEMFGDEGYTDHSQGRVYLAPNGAAFVLLWSIQHKELWPKIEEFVKRKRGRIVDVELMNDPGAGRMLPKRPEHTWLDMIKQFENKTGMFAWTGYSYFYFPVNDEFLVENTSHFEIVQDHNLMKRLKEEKFIAGRIFRNRNRIGIENYQSDYGDVDDLMEEFSAEHEKRAFELAKEFALQKWPSAEIGRYDINSDKFSKIAIRLWPEAVEEAGGANAAYDEEAGVFKFIACPQLGKIFYWYGRDYDSRPYHSDMYDDIRDEMNRRGLLEDWDEDSWHDPFYEEMEKMTGGYVTPDGQWETYGGGIPKATLKEILSPKLPSSWDRYSKIAVRLHLRQIYEAGGMQAASFDDPYNYPKYLKFIAVPETGEIVWWYAEGYEGYPWHSNVMQMISDELGVGDDYQQQFERQSKWQAGYFSGIAWTRYYTTGVSESTLEEIFAAKIKPIDRRKTSADQLPLWNETREFDTQITTVPMNRSDGVWHGGGYPWIYHKSKGQLFIGDKQMYHYEFFNGIENLSETLTKGYLNSNQNLSDFVIGRYNPRSGALGIFSYGTDDRAQEEHLTSVLKGWPDPGDKSSFYDEGSEDFYETNARATVT
jgi:hypothetical protein